MPLGNFWAVFRFEWRRVLSWPRMTWWAILTLFPTAIVLLIRFSARRPLPREPWTMFLFVLIPMLISMLGTFLWATPAVSTELERESWIYLAVRPHGRTALLLGKYLAAIAWVLPAALIAISMAVPVTHLSNGWQVWFALARIVCLSVPAYAAVYLMIGTIFTRRSMVVAVAYSLVFELVVRWVPAVINKFTVQYRLQALLLDWADLKIPPNARSMSAMTDLLGNDPAWWHVTVLIVYTLTLLSTALWLVNQHEFEVGRSADV